MIGELTENSHLQGNLSVGGLSVEYTAGTGINISDENVISNTITSYNDLQDKPNIPTIPENVSAFNNDAGYITNKYEEYSTDEIRVGTWIDGKPIYRKVYTGLKTPSTNSSWGTIYQDASLEYDKIINIGGYVYLNDYNNNEYHSAQCCEGSYYIHTKITYYQNKTCIDMIQNGWRNKDCVIILDYTKNE